VDNISDKPRMKFDIYSFYKKMEHNDIMLSFKGDITSELLTSMLQIMETKLENMDEQPKTRKKVYNVLVECLQNLYHHRDEMESAAANDETKKQAIFMISRNTLEYNIMTGNFVKNDKVAMLRNRIDKINGMTKEELKQHYQDVLSLEGFSEKGGGGLGFIDIARKSGQNLSYDFLQIDADYSFFSLYIKISQ
jgi:hypothetical protein